MHIHNSKKLAQAKISDAIGVSRGRGKTEKVLTDLHYFDPSIDLILLLFSVLCRSLRKFYKVMRDCRQVQDSSVGIFLKTERKRSMTSFLFLSIAP